MCSTDRFLKLILFLTVFPLVAASVAYPLMIGLPDVHMELDMAVMELYTRNAVHGDQFVGMYSRFGWNHPGPAFFYMLAPFYILTGERSSSIFWAAIMINTLAVLLIILSIRKIAELDITLAVCLSLMTAVFVLRFGVHNLASPWTPGAVVLPFLLFITVCSIFSVGGVNCLPAVMILGSLLIQMHIGIGPVIMAIITVSGILYAGWNRSDPTREKYFVIAAVGAVIIMWILPVVEEMTGRPGNLSKTARFFLENTHSNSLNEAAYSVAAQLTWFPLELLKKIGLNIPKFEYELLGLLLAGVLQIGMASVTVAAMKRGSILRANMGLILTVATLTALWSMTRIQGDIFGYLTFWISCIGCAGWALVFAEIAARFSERVGENRLRPGILISSLSLVIAVISTFYFLRLPTPFDSKKAERLSQGLVNYLRENNIKRPVFLFDWANWATEAPLILQLQKKGVIFAIRDVRDGHGKGGPFLPGSSYRPGDGDSCFISVISRDPSCGEKGRAAAQFEDSVVCVKDCAERTKD